MFRPIKAYQELNTAVERAVEAGRTGTPFPWDWLCDWFRQRAAAFAGLSLLSQIAEATTTSDKPIVATAGDGAHGHACPGNTSICLYAGQCTGTFQDHLGTDAWSYALFLHGRIAQLIGQ